MLTKQHSTGITIICSICGKKYKDKTLVVSIMLSIILTVVCCFIYKSNTSALLGFSKGLMDRGFAILPNLIGYSIAGLAIILGAFISNPNERLFKQRKGEIWTSFQKIIASFAFIILVYAFTLVVWLLFDLAISIKLYELLFCLPAWGTVTVCYLALIFIFFISFYAMFCLFDLVSQIFSCSQIFHYLMVTNKENKNAKKQ